PVLGAEAALAEQAVAAGLDEPAGELEVTPLAGHPEELHECHLDLGVPVDRKSTLRAELPVDGRDRSVRDLEQSVVAERPVPGNRGLDEVAEAVKLVAP